MDLTGTLVKFGKYDRYRLSVVFGLTILYSGLQSHNHIISSIQFTIAHFTNIQSITTFLNEKQINTHRSTVSLSCNHTALPLPNRYWVHQGHSPDAHKGPGVKSSSQLDFTIHFTVHFNHSVQFNSVLWFHSLITIDRTEIDKPYQHANHNIYINSIMQISQFMQCNE